MICTRRYFPRAEADRVVLELLAAGPRWFDSYGELSLWLAVHRLAAAGRARESVVSNVFTLIPS